MTTPTTLTPLTPAISLRTTNFIPLHALVALIRTDPSVLTSCRLWWSVVRITHILIDTDYRLCLLPASCGSAYSSTSKKEETRSSETSLDIQRLHGVISQKTEELFTITAIRTSNVQGIKYF
jgi:hypothetical protein